MMKRTQLINRTINSVMLGAATAWGITSCSDFDFDSHYNETSVQQYAQSFLEAFGNISADHDWNVASSVEANVNLDGIAEGPCTVRFYTAMPGGKDVSLLAAARYEGSEAVRFDALKGMAMVYVTVTDATGKLRYSNYMPIIDGRVSNQSKALRAASGHHVTVGEEVPVSGNFDARNLPKSEWGSVWTSWTDFSKFFKVYEINGMQTAISRDVSTKLSDLNEIVGPKGVFGEKFFDQLLLCNMRRYADQLHPAQGVEYVFAQGAGELSLSYFYGSTDKESKFGYLYYQEGASDEEIRRAPRFVLIDNAAPQENLKAGNKEFQGGTFIQTLLMHLNYYQGSDAVVSGTKYRVPYFGPEGKDAGTFEFPQGTHVVFFVVMDGAARHLLQVFSRDEVKGGDIRYSLPSLNHQFNYRHNEQHGAFYDEDACNFVSYRWGDRLVMGVEDGGGDDDMNDMLFFVDGSVTATAGEAEGGSAAGQDAAPELGTVSQLVDNPILDGPTFGQAQSYILSFEDMGAVGDFDFNDVVVSLSTATPGQLTVKLLAAGGTLPSSLWFRGNPLQWKPADGATFTVTDIHEAFMADPDVMVNTGLSSRTYTPTLVIPVEATFSIADQASEIELHVTKRNGEESVIAMPSKQEPGAIPHALLVGDSSWEWPRERQCISKDENHPTGKYERFQAWVSDPTMPEWWKEKSDITVDEQTPTDDAVQDNPPVIVQPDQPAADAPTPYGTPIQYRDGWGYHTNTILNRRDVDAIKPDGNVTITLVFSNLYAFNGSVNEAFVSYNYDPWGNYCAFKYYDWDVNTLTATIALSRQEILDHWPNGADFTMCLNYSNLKLEGIYIK